MEKLQTGMSKNSGQGLFYFFLREIRNQNFERFPLGDTEATPVGIETPYASYTRGSGCRTTSSIRSVDIMTHEWEPGLSRVARATRSFGDGRPGSLGYSCVAGSGGAFGGRANGRLVIGTTIPSTSSASFLKGRMDLRTCRKTQPPKSTAPRAGRRQ